MSSIEHPFISVSIFSLEKASLDNVKQKDKMMKKSI